MSHVRSLIVAIAVAGGSFVAGCSGGSPLVRLQPPERSPESPQQVTFRLDAPLPSPSSTHRSPHYLSPATQSITVAITPQASCGTCSTPPPLTASLTLTNQQQCTSTLASVQCMLSVSLSPGSYNASITTYDGPNGTGSVLSENQNVPFTVVAGQSNVVPLTLYGVPSHYVYSIVGSSPSLVTISTSGSTPTLSFAASPASVTVAVSPVDADDNFIVGLGAPVISAGIPPQNVTVTPVANDPNAFTIAVQPPVIGTATTISFTATYPSGQSPCSGSIRCTSVLAIQAPQILAVGNYGNDTVALFQLPLTASSTAFQSINLPSSVTISGTSYGSMEPAGLAADSNGNLYVLLSNLWSSYTTCTPGGTYGTTPTLPAMEILEYSLSNGSYTLTAQSTPGIACATGGMAVEGSTLYVAQSPYSTQNGQAPAEIDTVSLPVTGSTITATRLLQLPASNNPGYNNAVQGLAFDPNGMMLVDFPGTTASGGVTYPWGIYQIPAPYTGAFPTTPYINGTAITVSAIVSNGTIYIETAQNLQQGITSYTYTTPPTNSVGGNLVGVNSTGCNSSNGGWYPPDADAIYAPAGGQAQLLVATWSCNSSPGLQFYSVPLSVANGTLATLQGTLTGNGVNVPASLAIIP